jgi:hypothetical protein
MPLPDCGDRPRRGCGIAADREVEVGDLAAEGGVAYGAAGDPGRVAFGQRPTGGRDRR